MKEVFKVYENLNKYSVKACTFHWFDDESDDWEMGKNCDEIA